MTQMDIRIASEPILVILLWAVVYTMDYLLTIIGGRLYQDRAKSFVRFEGSYELTPVFRDDVDALRLISPRFIRFLVISIALILLVWVLDVEVRGGYYIFAGVVGGLFLREGTIYLRHIRNIALFILVRSADSIRGQIEYRKWLTYRISSIELVSFAIFYFLLFLLNKGWFFLGGAAACAVTGVQHFISSMGERATPSTRESEEPEFGPFQ